MTSSSECDLNVLERIQWHLQACLVEFGREPSKIMLTKLEAAQLVQEVCGGVTLTLKGVEGNEVLSVTGTEVSYVVSETTHHCIPVWVI